MFDTPQLLDGGFSTALEQLGNSLNTSLWTGELLRNGHDQIRAAHELFVNAGAEILITSSYQLTYPGGEARDWSVNEVDEAFVISTELARFNGVKVAASVGPYGAYLADGSEYRGNYGLHQKELENFHRERLIKLVRTKPDLLAIETIPEITEAKAIISLLSEIDCTIPAWISFSCRSGSELSSGEKFKDAVEVIAQSHNVVAAGINCTPPEFVADLLHSSKTTIPFIVYPNSGRSWDAHTKKWIGQECSGISASEIDRWIELGAKGIGGCCGVSPSDIFTMAESVKRSR